jgi:antitoxin YefM
LRWKLAASRQRKNARTESDQALIESPSAVWHHSLNDRRRSPSRTFLDPQSLDMYNYPVHVSQEGDMPNVTTYTNARATFAALCDEVSSTREPVIIRRRNAADVALVSADELESLIETAHLMRSPRNAARLLAALARAQAGELPPSTIDDLREALGLGQEAE